MTKLAAPFKFESFIPESQLLYHNFSNVPGLRVTLIEGADYEEAKRYCSWHAKEVGQPEYMHFKSDLRQQANKIPYLEAFEQLGAQDWEVDFVCQAISDGGGIVGADLAASDALAERWISRKPAFVVTQPRAANPVVRCFKKGYSSYHPSCTLPKLGRSRAFAIRRKDASGYYGILHSVIKDGGFALDATEEDIRVSKQVMLEFENVDAGYTACTSLAAIRKENLARGTFRRKRLLVMITGVDRPTKIIPRIDNVVPKSKWKWIIDKS